MQGPGAPLFLTLGFIAFFVLMWCLTCFAASVMSGWFALTRRFRRQDGPYGDTRAAGPWFNTVYLRLWVHYSGVVRLVAASDVLYLSVLALFRAGHPPLRIPWREIEASRKRYLFRRYVQLRLGRQEQIPMRISESAAVELGILDRFPALASTPSAAHQALGASNR